MINGKRISSILLLMSLFVNCGSVYANNKISNETNNNEIIKVRELKKGTVDSIKLKVNSMEIKDIIKFRVINKNTKEYKDYYSYNGKIENIIVEEDEIYSIELLENEKYKINSIEFKVKYDSMFICVLNNGNRLNEIELIKKSIYEFKGWKFEDNNWKYYEEGNLKKGWIFDKVDNIWYCSNEKGNRITGWYFDKNYNNYYYFDKDGKMQTGWIVENGKKYYLNSSGELIKSTWISEDNKWFYLKETGEIDTGWLLYKNNWYYLNQEGIMQNGWIHLSGKWYYLDGSGKMNTGWIKYNSDWYYINDKGYMEIDWIYQGNKWHYLNKDGRWNKSGISFANWYVINGQLKSNNGDNLANVGENYIIVSLSYQKLWLVRNNDVILNTGIISGKPSTPTVIGNFRIQNKEINRILRGEDYSVKVKYWVPFYGDYGIHDADWQPSKYVFDNPNSYKYRGSHGCVNIFPGNMKQIYDSSYIGMPVIVIP